MSSIGASYAGVYVMQKQQKEKMKKKKNKQQEELVEETSKVSAVHGHGRNNNKIHPGNFHVPNTTSTAGPVEEGHNNS
ncbi:hypothetical protein D8674_013246 [Pyrus ussuriensis x Pyrus communis]|uniref:Uncharacterized protein n=1 Tax=Pyrus ussuriensis x Pyrus communis TaxID=2448454 RepID=A0A5N5GQG1_9ROSA|nr:hypothetical protein D8674_013246 [Pyrus ussuriensis x Pyrus communis]